MTYAEGGYIEESGRNKPPIVRDGCDYYIPASFAAKWKEHLEWLNKMLDSEREASVE